MMWATLILLCAPCYLSYGAKILGVLRTESKSRYSNIRNVADELASRGHEVTLVVPSTLSYPPSSTIKHSVYKYPFGKDHLEKTMVPKAHSETLSEILLISQIAIDYLLVSCRALTAHVKLHRNELRKFDLMFCDPPPECGSIVSEVLGLRRIDIKPAFAMRMYNDLSVASYIPVLSHASDKMTFLGRVKNLLYLTIMATKRSRLTKLYDGLRREFDLQEMTSFMDSINMAELVIIMGHFALEYPQPILPSMKLVGPLTIRPPNPLPRDLEQFISGAGDKGIILFSLGTIGDAILQKSKVEMLAKVFDQLEQRIIWRLKGYDPKDLPSNIKVLPWIPQIDLLAHKSTKAFISHTGHNSLYEAAFYGVPVVCVPVFFDQYSNCAQAQSVGIAIGIDIKTATGDEIYHSIKRILEEPSFKGNATRISRLLRDSPQTFVQQAADWIEYVHRHKGAKHLRPEVYNLHWYQYYLLDVLLFLATAFIVFCIAIRMLCRLLSRIFAKNWKKVGSHSKQE